MEKFYEAPWRDTAGSNPQPQMEATNPNLVMPTQQGFSNTTASPAMTNHVMPQEAYDMGGNRRNLLSQYLTKPMTNNTNTNNFFRNI